MFERSHLPDYAAWAVGPTLIFLMIASLANFFVMLFYSGGYSDRIFYLIAMYTMGSVALARIVIEENRAYSAGYAIALGAAMLFVMTGFLGSLVFTLGLVLLIGYLSDRIVHDCTVIDASVDASGEGLIDRGLDEALGLRSKLQDAPSDDVEAPVSEKERRRRKTHQPGRTVFLLALAALPLFGIGQFVLQNNPAVWQRAQLMLGLYLFSSLSLLVTTSFLNLRRYLRQRDVDMPANVTIAWITGGIGMVAGLLFLAFLAPLPGQALANISLPRFLKSDVKQASSMGWGNEGADESNNENDAESNGDPHPGEKPQKGAGQNQNQPSGQLGGKKPSSKSSPNGEKSQGEKSQGEKSQGEKSQGEKSQGEKSQGEKSQGEKSQGEKSQGEKSQGEKSQGEKSQGEKSQGEKSQGEKSQGEKPQGEKSQGEKPQGEKPQSNGSEQEKQDESGNEDSTDSKKSPEPNDAASDAQQADRDKKQQEQARQQREREERRKQQQQQQNQERRNQNKTSSSNDSGQPSQSSSSPSFPSLMPAIGGLFRLLLILGLFAIVAYYIYLMRDHIARWWQSLFDRDRAGDGDPDAESSTPLVTTPPKRFASFVNPIGREADPRRIIVITFQAFEAWARERGLERSMDETPTELVARIRRMPASSRPPGLVDAEIQSHLTRLAHSYDRIVYGRGQATKVDLATAKTLWDHMTNLRTPVPT